MQNYACVLCSESSDGVLQDESNPDFVAEVVELYFEDSAGKLDKLESKLAAPVPDFNDVDQLVHQFKGSSASFGAQSLAALCVQVCLNPRSGKAANLACKV